LLVIPLLPLLYIQGKRIKASIPQLPEAAGPRGIAKGGIGKPIRLLAIGESTIAGVGVATHEEGLTGTLAQTLATEETGDVHWWVYARSGYTAKLVREKLLPKIKESSFDLIVVGLGGNDAFYLNHPKRWRRDIEELIIAIQKQFRGTPIFFTNMPPIREFPAFTRPIQFVVGGLIEILGQELAASVRDYPMVFYNAEIITLASWTRRWQISGQASDFFSDGVHPAPITYQIWGKEMAKFIQYHLPNL
ncbi:MAG: SGNH/GDSL hydrolase family protein, partial [Bacteroidota bacterium]